eukprot:g1586.t1
MMLLQLTVLSRHGATAPKHGYFCWNKNTEQWNCTNTEVMYTDFQRDESTVSSRPLRRLFHKIYQRDKNEAMGTCGAGHLLTTGQMQAMANGLSLQKMYVGPDHVNLWPTSDLREITDKNFFRMRVADSSAATMSAMGLFNSFFTEADSYKGRAYNLPIVTRDYEADWMHPNENLCPRMQQARLVMQKSSEFWNLNSSLGPLTAQMRQAVGNGFQWEHAVDCLMTARCSKQLLPKALTEDTFNKAIDACEKLAQVKYTFNHSYYAKLAVREMLTEIYNGMIAAMEHQLGHKALQLYSGDRDIRMAFLAAREGNVSDGKLPPYGAMVVIELFQLQIPSPTHPAGWMHAFRMVYNGKPVTLPGCSQPLCDFDVFKAFVRTSRWGCYLLQLSLELLPAAAADDDSVPAATMDDGFDAEEEERLKGIERYREVYEMSAIDGSMGGQESAELRELRVKHGISDDMAAQIAAETTQPSAEADMIQPPVPDMVFPNQPTSNPVHNFGVDPNHFADMNVANLSGEEGDAGERRSGS